MKIRTGFVSNSSSSSFLVFMQKPKSIDDLCLKMWNISDKDELNEMQRMALHSIFNSLNSESDCSLIAALGEMSDSGYYDEYNKVFVIDVDDKDETFTIDDINYMYEHLDECDDPKLIFASDMGLVPKTNVDIINILKEIKERTKDDKIIYYFSYDDHSDFECYMHDGEGFGNLDYISFSHH